MIYQMTCSSKNAKYVWYEACPARGSCFKHKAWTSAVQLLKVRRGNVIWKSPATELSCLLKKTDYISGVTQLVCHAFQIKELPLLVKRRCLFAVKVTEVNVVTEACVATVVAA